MGTSLFNTTPAATYPALIKVGDNTSIDGALKVLSDGAGNDLPIQVSSTVTNFTGNVGIGTTAPNTLLVVNSTTTPVNATFDALSTATILGDQQSPLRVLRTSGQSNIYIGTSNETPDHSQFLAGIRTGAWYNTASPTYSGQFGAYFINRANQWGTQTSASDLRMSHTFTCNGTTTRSALFITPLSAESATNTDYVAVNNLLVTTAANFGTQPTARVQIVGDGSTSATTSLLVRNSAGTETFKVLDSGTVSLNGSFSAGNISTTYLTTSSLILGNALPRIYNANQLNANLSVNTTGIVASTSAYSGSTASAVLEATSTTQGFLPPRMTTLQRNAISSPANGLIVFDTDVQNLCYRRDSTWVQVSFTAV